MSNPIEIVITPSEYFRRFGFSSKRALMDHLAKGKKIPHVIEYRKSTAGFLLELEEQVYRTPKTKSK